jgi:colanic acid/amylovoran biosynthesis glycosyltransferase
MHCEIPEVIENGVSGVLSHERDVDGLEEHLCWLIDNPDQWAPMVASGRRHVECEFDAVAQGARLAAIYASVLSD